MNRVLLPFPRQRALAGAMAMPLGARVGRLDWRRFPDGGSRVAVDDALSGADVAIAASLHHPDELRPLLVLGARRGCQGRATATA